MTIVDLDPSLAPLIHQLCRPRSTKHILKRTYLGITSFNPHHQSQIIIIIIIIIIQQLVSSPRDYTTTAIEPSIQQNSIVFSAHLFRFTAPPLFSLNPQPFYSSPLTSSDPPLPPLSFAHLVKATAPSTPTYTNWVPKPSIKVTRYHDTLYERQH